MNDHPHMYHAQALVDGGMPPLVSKTWRHKKAGVWFNGRGGDLDWIEAVADTREGAIEAIERWRR